MVDVSTSALNSRSETTLIKCYVGTHIIMIKVQISDYLLIDEFGLINSPKLEARKLDCVMVFDEQIHNK